MYLLDVLILHLKRLVINSTGGGKIRTLVKFPIENLDLSPFLCGMFTITKQHVDVCMYVCTVCMYCMYVYICICMFLTCWHGMYM